MFFSIYAWIFDLFAASRSDIKKKLEVSGFNLNRCGQVYRLAGITLNPKQLCAGGEEGKDSCNGDSGKFENMLSIFFNLWKYFIKIRWSIDGRRYIQSIESIRLLGWSCIVRTTHLWHSRISRRLHGSSLIFALTWFEMNAFCDFHSTESRSIFRLDYEPYEALNCWANIVF